MNIMIITFIFHQKQFDMVFDLFLINTLNIFEYFYIQTH